MGQIQIQGLVHKMDILERLNSHVELIPFSTCWWFTGSLRQGYGRISKNGRPVSAHRLSYELHKGEIPEGLHVCHTCDNRSCVNPDHLFAGTQQDNMDDMVKKGRWGGADQKGEMHSSVKLTEPDVLEIRELAGTMTQRKIADKFNVGFVQISRIISRDRWSHI